jgi:dipeptidyl aminopeptidase/acylaminoacyl peptidase
MRTLLMAALAGMAALALMMSWPGPTSAEDLTMQELQQAFAQDTTVTLPSTGIRIESFGYVHSGSFVEAILFRPAKSGVRPGVMLIPGYSRSAVDYIPMSLALAKRGYACLAVTQPGFGRSSGHPDFVGPSTVSALSDGYSRFVAVPFVDSTRTVLFGYSRGAMAASLMACRLPGLRGAILGGGIYDLSAAYREIECEGIRRNIEAETGGDPSALRERSSLYLVDQFQCPVFILHGENDPSAPVSQAFRLHERLLEAGKSSQLEVVEGAGHGLAPHLVLKHILGCLERWLNHADMD